MRFTLFGKDELVVKTGSLPPTQATPPRIILRRSRAYEFNETLCTNGEPDAQYYEIDAVVVDDNGGRS